LSKLLTKEYSIEDLIDFNSKQKILHIPMSEIDANVIKLFKSWKGNLNKYNIQISTGPVVPFRSREFISDNNSDKEKNYVPLYWMHNTSEMKFEWPVIKQGKGQYIQVCNSSKHLLIPNKNYIFLRRFSSKDDKKRLIASPYFFDFQTTELIGVENHLNYIYRPKGELERNEILGLAALLNSSLFDTYFRTFNGNINVSATELREIPLPPLDDIKKIGNLIISNNKSNV
jgi:adenine-specific DNA-methyltransferase